MAVAEVAVVEAQDQMMALPRGAPILLISLAGQIRDHAGTEAGLLNARQASQDQLLLDPVPPVAAHLEAI
ncbi:hypothetical protein BM221_004389 [Beauveria bassiana]|uniref:Uncharacterized protein n=1 Tax=Beauveria bassiana TaxID=176275 RepID=A0A2N6NR42_BEABA|nr:hypothetical protein BM221_004389 [Beauveria bassiana]